MSKGVTAQEAPPTTASLHQEIARLQDTLARRDDFLALAAHELRNPMHALSLQITAARVAAQAAGAADVVTQLTRAQDTLARYISRATSLLDLIRLGAQSYPIQPRPTDLSEQLRHIAEGQRAEGRYHGTEIVLDLPESYPAHTDPAALEHIVVNLLSNAFKHACGTTVRVTLQTLPGGLAQVTVTDNGRGIAAADVQRIFGKFERDDSAAQAGCGLGLWLSRQLAESLGGDLRLDPQHPAGAAFMLRIPAFLKTLDR